MESCCRVPCKCLRGKKKRFFKRVDENWARWPAILKSFPHYPSPAGQSRKLVWLFLGGQWMGPNCNDVLCCQNLTWICRLKSLSSDSPKQLKIMWSFPSNHPTMNRSKCWDFFICFLFSFLGLLPPCSSNSSLWPWGLEAYFVNNELKNTTAIERLAI